MNALQKFQKMFKRNRGPRPTAAAKPRARRERRQAMTRRVFAFSAFFLLAGATDASSAAPASDDASESRDIPAAFAPFEYLVGEWNGQAIPKDKAANSSAAGPKNTPGPGSSPRESPAAFRSRSKAAKSSLPAR